MWTRAIATAFIGILVTVAPASAQRVELSGIFGWTLSDGVTGGPVVMPDGNRYDAIDLKDAFSWGFSAGVLANDQVEIGFLFGQQLSTLAVEGTRTVDIGDITINTYHPYVAFNFGEVDAVARPYFLIGFGATNFSSVSFTAGGQALETGSETQFSTTWGGGVKIFPSPNVGFRAGIQWTPTYIKSDPGGWWCDPYWGCYLVGDAQYSNQFQFNGGVTVRF
jgi:opacity protein-like surface antigen